jgi:hypothetical protein
MEEIRLLDDIERSVEELRTGDRTVSEFELYRNIQSYIETLRSLLIIRSVTKEYLI